MNSSLLITVVGVAAAFCSMTSFAPQLVKIWREKDASSVSLRMYVVTVSGFALWTGYGVLIGKWPIVASNTVCLLMSGAVLFLKFRYPGDTEKEAGGNDR